MAGTRPRPCGRRGPSVNRDPSGLHWMSWSRVRRSLTYRDEGERERRYALQAQKQHDAEVAAKEAGAPAPRKEVFIRHPVFSKVVGVATREVARATTHARNLRGGAHYDDMLKGFSQLTKHLRKHVTFDQGFYNLTAQGGEAAAPSGRSETCWPCVILVDLIPCGAHLLFYLQNRRHASRRSRRSGADSSRSVASRCRGGGGSWSGAGRPGRGGSWSMIWRVARSGG